MSICIQASAMCLMLSNTNDCFRSGTRIVALRRAFELLRAQVGDASACQSPLSFGGFGSMVRHLPRLTQVRGSRTTFLTRPAMHAVNGIRLPMQQATKLGLLQSIWLCAYP